jgi:hypothetical protein
MALLLLMTAGPIGIWQIPSQATAGVYVGLLLWLNLINHACHHGMMD